MACIRRTLLPLGGSTAIRSAIRQNSIIPHNTLEYELIVSVIDSKARVRQDTGLETYFPARVGAVPGG